MYKGRILALEPSDSLDAVLELAVQSLVQVVVVIIELLLQVNVPDMGKPKALPAPERLCGSAQNTCSPSVTNTQVDTPA